MDVNNEGFFEPLAQEPVATDWERIARVQNAKLMAMCNEAGGFEKLCEVMDKYEQTTPPQHALMAEHWKAEYDKLKAACKPLTDEEIAEIYVNTSGIDFYLLFARAIEAAHGIKGEA